MIFVLSALPFFGMLVLAAVGYAVIVLTDKTRSERSRPSASLGSAPLFDAHSDRKS